MSSGGKVVGESSLAVEKTLNMETEEGGGDINDAIIFKNIARGKTADQCVKCAGIIGEDTGENHGININLKIDKLKHDLRKEIIGDNGKYDDASNDGGMYLDKDISHACPNELFRRRIEELDTELKKYDEHVTSFKQMDFSSITIPQT